MPSQAPVIAHHQIHQTLPCLPSHIYRQAEPTDNISSAGQGAARHVHDGLAAGEGRRTMLSSARVLVSPGVSLCFL